MKTPVIIAAYNEQEHIASALGKLPLNADPVVVANGCNDNTAEVARGFGIEPIELEQKSKVLALQKGIETLGTRALEGFVILDADSVPVFPKLWMNTMQSKLDESSCRVFCGPVVFGSEKGWFAGVLRSIRNAGRDIHADITRSNRLYGANMAVRPTEKSLEEILDMPAELWPGEDRAIKHIQENNGAEYELHADPRILVKVSARSHNDFVTRLKKGSEWSKLECDKWYQSKAPTNSINYEQWVELFNFEQGL